MQDEELIARVGGQRDHEAFTQLLDRHLGALTGFLARLSGNPADAEDLAQETFTRVWQHAGRFEQGRVKFTTWLYRIGRNLSIDAHRKHRETTGIEALELEDERAPLDAQLDAEGTARAVRATIESLPERQRTALLLCHYQGMSNIMAAEVLDVSVEALESLLARARRRLRTELAPLLGASSRRAQRPTRCQ